MMKKWVICGLLACPALLRAQTIVQRDPVIGKMVATVNADSLHSYILQLVKFDTRSTISSTTDVKKGIGAARNWVLHKMESFAPASGGRLTVKLDTTAYAADGKRVDKDINLGNVVATLKGTDPNDPRVYIISGHLDSRVTDVMDRVHTAPGANDDGSGSAAVIELARVMSQQSFPATIIFVTVSGEEQGLLGATYMAKKAKQENWQIDAMLNNDIIGQSTSSQTLLNDNTKVRVFSEGIPATADEAMIKRIKSMGMENDSRSRQLARYIKETGERYVDQLEVKLEYRADRFLRGGDHSPFQQQGFTAVRITEMNENFDRQHQDLRTENGIQYGDLPEYMDFEYLRKNAAMNLSVLANLASAPAEPEAVKIDVKELTNYSSLSWAPPKYGKAKGYYVLMRETSSPVWEKKFYTTETSMRLPYSKDNYYFAVQAVGEGGQESLAVFPEVGR
ncbi:M28 family metallopeptidase [Chitinophaga parva]|nr:M28 family metallopeptidase [Chitinophaga parva]